MKSEFYHYTDYYFCLVFFVISHSLAILNDMKAYKVLHCFF